MDATDYIISDIAAQGTVFDVYRRGDDGAYSGDFSKVGSTTVAVFSPSAQHEVTSEGSDDPASYTGLLAVTRTDGSIEHVVKQDDQLRASGQRYDVVVKQGVPNDHDPDVWQLGLNGAAST